MYQDYKDLLSAFQFHGVKYLVVGGFAVIDRHSQPRFTKDIDLFIKAEPENANATYAVLAQFGASLQGMRPEDLTDRNTFFRFERAQIMASLDWSQCPVVESIPGKSERRRIGHFFFIDVYAS